jgi:hypothetical protein
MSRGHDQRLSALHRGYLDTVDKNSARWRIKIVDMQIARLIRWNLAAKRERSNE